VVLEPRHLDLPAPLTASEHLAPSPRPSQPLAGFFGRDLIYVALWAAQLGLATLLTPVITRLLGAFHYGKVVICITLMQLLVALAGFGLNVAIQRTYTNRGERAARQVVTLSICIATVCLVIATATGPLWSKALHLGPYTGAVAYTVDWAMCSAVTQTVLGLLRCRDQLRRFALISLMQTTLSEALSLALVVFVRRTANEYILGELLGQAATLGVGLVFARPTWLRRRDRRRLGAVLRFSAPLVPVALSGFVLSASGRLIVNADLGRVAAARYGVASNVGSIAILLLFALFESWMPRVFALSEADAVDDVLSQSRDTLYALLLPMTFGLCIASPLLLRLWAPPSFHPDGLQFYVAVIVIATFPAAGASSSSRVLLRSGKTRPAATANIGAALANVVLNIALVPLIGIAGSTLSTLSAYSAMHVFLKRQSQAIAPIRGPSRRLVFDMALAVTLILLTPLLPLTLPFMLLRGFIGICCALVAVALLYVLRTPSDRVGLRQLSHWLSARTGVA
jgi:O-antigen/teichoic acid export membrane protein